MQPAYSIGVTAKLTGFPPETLRAWERRYGWPRPQRHPGGQRTYDDGEIARLKLIARALEAGHRPREVVPLSLRALEGLEGTAPRVVASSADSRADACCEALRRDDATMLERELRSAATLLGPIDFVSQIAGPLTVRVGTLWEAGELEVRQEHLFTAALSTQLRVLLSMHAQSSGPVVVLATFSGELHGLGLEMVAVHIAARGGAPRLLGPNLEPKEIAAATVALGGDAIGISASSASSLASTERNMRALLASTKVPIWLGGAGASRIRLRHRRSKIIDCWNALDDALYLIS